MGATTAQDRYGTAARARRRRPTIVGWAFVAAAALGLLLWVALQWATPAVRGTLLGYSDVHDDSVTVRLLVTKDADATAVCRLRAQAQDHRTVGTAQVRLAPPEHGASSEVAVVVPTRSRPVNGELVGCSLG